MIPKGHPDRKLRNFLLAPGIQTTMGFYTAILSFIFTIAVVWILYINLFELGEIVLALTDSENKIQELFQEYIKNIRWHIITAGGVFFMAMIGLSVVYTHKMVGPTIAFSLHVNKLKEGDYSSRIKLRPGDAFHELGDELNELAEELENRRNSPKS